MTFLPLVVVCLSFYSLILSTVIIYKIPYISINYLSVCDVFLLGTEETGQLRKCYYPAPQCIGISVYIPLKELAKRVKDMF